MAAIAEAKAVIEARPAERYARERAAYERKLAERKAKQDSTGHKSGGAPPSEPEPGPRLLETVNDRLALRAILAIRDQPSRSQLFQLFEPTFHRVRAIGAPF